MNFKHNLLYLFIFISFCSLASCAVAPFATDHSAAPLGEDNRGIDFGLSPMPYFQFALGLRDDLDLGGGIELQFGYSLYAYGKWNVYTEHKRGWSLALLGGGGLGYSLINTKFIFAGPIGSWRHHNFEAFLHPRYNVLMYDRFHAEGDNTATKGFDLDGGVFDYVQVAAGVQYYFQPTFAMGITGIAMPPGPGEPLYVAPGISALLRF